MEGTGFSLSPDTVCQERATAVTPEQTALKATQPSAKIEQMKAFTLLIELNAR